MIFLWFSISKNTVHPHNNNLGGSRLEVLMMILCFDSRLSLSYFLVFYLRSFFFEVELPPQMAQKSLGFISWVSGSRVAFIGVPVPFYIFTSVYHVVFPSNHVRNFPSSSFFCLWRADSCGTWPHLAWIVNSNGFGF